MDDIYEKLTMGVRKPKKHKVALFLCGSAGTGKSTHKSKFVEDAGITSTYVYLNIDQVWDMLGKKGDISKEYDSLVKKVITDGYSFVYDGTCRNFEKTHSIIKEAKAKGYHVKLTMVYTKLKTVLERLKKRKEQPLKEDLAKKIFEDISKIAKQYMHLDELFLYNNDDELTLIYSKSANKINCVHPEMAFYFDVRNYCKDNAA
jgi:predicted ABC-type ATPase